jgi:4-hydroxybenzoate polyprenyltransferase
VLGLIRVIHPAPALTVTALSGALAAILLAQDGQALGPRLALTVLAVAGSQILTGALNDWADRDRDRVAQPSKPIASGAVTPSSALTLAIAGGTVQVIASLPLGWPALLLGLVASASAIGYDLWLARTPFSVVPYLVSFGILPLWIAAGVGVPLSRVAVAPLIVGPFAAAAHLANTLRDFDTDAGLGARNLAQTLGRRAAMTLAWALAVGVGIAVGIAFMVGGSLGAPTVGLGVIGLAAVIQGAGSAQRLWYGMLVAALCWTVAWALGTG